MQRPKQESLSLLFRERNAQYHMKGINRLASTQESLFTAGRDGIIREWDPTPDTPTLRHLYDGHTHWVNDLQIDSANHRSTLYVSVFRLLRLLHRYLGHQSK